MADSTPSTPLARLLAAALERRGWTPTRLHQEVSGRGADVSYSAVHGWTTGRASIADRNRIIVADALGIPLDLVARAAAGIEISLPADPDPAAEGAA